MTKRSVNFSRVLGDAAISGTEAVAILEIAYAMANANGDASFDELDSFRSLAKHLAPARPVREIFEAFAAAFENESIEDRVRDAAKRLPSEAAREAAYKAAYAIAVFDLETNEDERALDELLIEVLDLGARVDALELQVNEALIE